jgi:acetyl-CoA acyltransferase
VFRDGSDADYAVICKTGTAPNFAVFAKLRTCPPFAPARKVLVRICGAEHQAQVIFCRCEKVSLGVLMPEAVIVDCVRTAVGKSGRGTLRNTRPDDLAAFVMRALLDKYPQVTAEDVEDVILGCAMPEGEAGTNMARVALLRAGFPVTTTGVTINRFCSSGLQAIAMAADRIKAGGAHILIAGGSESMSMIPMAGNKPAPNPWMADHRPEIYINMGLTAEAVQRKYGVSREDADAFSYLSHQNALMAQSKGNFDDEIVPVTVKSTVLNGDGKPHQVETVFNKDEGPRADTSVEALGKLKPVFHVKGTVTAGNSSQTSDGAAAALVMSEKKAKELGLKPRARFVSFATGGVPPEIMGIGPVVAIPKALAMAGLKMEDVGVIELNEAFAVQALAVIRVAGLNPDIVNMNGGAVALGHPLGCTGAKLTATALREMERRNARYGMITMCVGGGQGAAGIIERL